MDQVTLHHLDRSCEAAMLEVPAKPQPTTARWHADLQEYDFEIKYIPGKTNTPADELSRPAQADQGKEDNQNDTMIPSTKYTAATTHTLGDDLAKRDLMTWAHDHPTAGHPGRDETIRRVRTRHTWPGMNAWITAYVKGCATCHQTKINTHRPKIPLYRISIPNDTRPFQQVAMDL